MNSSNYVKGVNDAKKAMKGYAQDNQKFASVVKGAGATIAKFAGGLGLAVTAGEGFKRLLSSSQTLGDLTASNMKALKISVDEFFYAISTGGFDSFFSGLDGIISRSKEAYAAMDQLGNTQISYGVISSINKSKIADAQYVAKNKFAPLEERIGAFGDWRGALDAEMKAVQSLRGEVANATIKEVQSRMEADVDFGLNDIIKAFEVDLMTKGQRSLSKDRAKNGVNNYKAWSNAHKGEEWDEQRMQRAEAQKQNMIIHALLEKYTDEELQGIADKITQYYNLNEALKSVAREYNETATEFNNSNKSIKGFNPVESLEGYTVYTGTTTANKDFAGEKYAAGSLAALDEQIKAASKDYAEAASEAARSAALKTLNALKGQKVEIEFRAKFPNAPGGVSDSGTGPLASLAQIPEIPTTIDINANTNFEKANNDAMTLTDSLHGISDAFNQIGSSVSGETGNMIQYFANVLNGTIQVAAAIQALIPLREAEAGANAKAAATGAASAVAGIPIVGPLMAVAAIASLVAAISAIPNFADGGIVPGSNFRDGIRANVSSGEMFINQHDQSKLFKAIKSGNFGGGGGEVVLTGEKLVMAINNYGKRSGRGVILK